MTLGDRVFDYVNRNPGITYRQLAEGMALSSSHARSCLNRLRDHGALISRKNGNDPRRFYPSNDRIITQRVTSRAQHIGHPFGILAAQVMV